MIINIDCIWKGIWRMENINIQGQEIFEKGLKDLGIQLTQEQKEQFMKYYELLIEWNTVMNLTAITDFTEVIEKHFLDSLSLVQAMEVKNEKILDIGTGAGFPGIPLKIAFPELDITLLDSLNKRIKFLNHVIETLGLKNIKALHGRAEDYGKNVEYRESYDIVVSRAVAKISTLSEYCIPYVKKEGYFIPYKSGQIEEELRNGEKAVKILGAEIEKVHHFHLPGTEIDRSLILIKKFKNTPMKYPRSAGKPSKEPLE